MLSVLHKITKPLATVYTIKNKFNFQWLMDTIQAMDECDISKQKLIKIQYITIISFGGYLVICDDVSWKEKSIFVK